MYSYPDISWRIMKSGGCGQDHPDIIKLATDKLKTGKSDSIFSFSTDCFQNHSVSLFTSVLYSIVSLSNVHGHVTNILLLATLVTTIKDKPWRDQCQQEVP